MTRCTPCIKKEIVRKWKAERRDYVNAKERERVRAAKLAGTHPKCTWQERNKDKSAAKSRRWRLNNPERAKEIAMFFLIARRVTQCTGIKFEVDHIVPINGKNVCGLHVPNNLRVIPKVENIRKRNHYEGPDSWPVRVVHSQAWTTSRPSPTSQDS